MQLCSSYKKPNNQTVLRHSAVRSFLWDMPFTNVCRWDEPVSMWTCRTSLNSRQIRNLGGKLGRAVAEEFKAETVGELLYVNPMDGLLTAGVCP